MVLLLRSRVLAVLVLLIAVGLPLLGVSLGAMLSALLLVLAVAFAPLGWWFRPRPLSERRARALLDENPTALDALGASWDVLGACWCRIPWWLWRCELVCFVERGTGLTCCCSFYRGRFRGRVFSSYFRSGMELTTTPTGYVIPMRHAEAAGVLSELYHVSAEDWDSPRLLRVHRAEVDFLCRCGDSVAFRDAPVALWTHWCERAQREVSWLYGTPPRLFESALWRAWEPLQRGYRMTLAEQREARLIDPSSWLGACAEDGSEEVVPFNVS